VTSVDWAEKFDASVQYLTSIPDLEFFDNVEPDSLVVLDDLWTECCESSQVVKAFKVFSRKMRLSLVIISQCYFGGGQGGREIRNNTDVIVLFENHGDASLNKRIMLKLGYANAYKQALQTLLSRTHAYLVINCNANLCNKMRVATNLFSEFHDNIEFFV
jgi:hypothetical protein